jgi:hypothetical protein
MFALLCRPGELGQPAAASGPPPSIPHDRPRDCADQSRTCQRRLKADPVSPPEFDPSFEPGSSRAREEVGADSGGLGGDPSAGRRLGLGGDRTACVSRHRSPARSAHIPHAQGSLHRRGPNHRRGSGPTSTGGPIRGPPETAPSRTPSWPMRAAPKRPRLPVRSRSNYFANTEKPSASECSARNRPERKQPSWPTKP